MLAPAQTQQVFEVREFQRSTLKRPKDHRESIYQRLSQQSGDQWEAPLFFAVLDRGIAGASRHEERVLQSVGFRRTEQLVVITASPSARGQLDRVQRMVTAYAALKIPSDNFVSGGSRVKRGIDVLNGNGLHSETTYLGDGGFIRVETGRGQTSLAWTSARPLGEIAAALLEYHKIDKDRDATIASRDDKGNLAEPIHLESEEALRAAVSRESNAIAYARVPFDEFTLIWRLRRSQTVAQHTLAEVGLVYPGDSKRVDARPLFVTVGNDDAAKARLFFEKSTVAGRQ